MRLKPGMKVRVKHKNSHGCINANVRGFVTLDMQSDIGLTKNHGLSWWVFLPVSIDDGFVNIRCMILPYNLRKLCI